MGVGSPPPIQSSDYIDREDRLDFYFRVTASNTLMQFEAVGLNGVFDTFNITINH